MKIIFFIGYSLLNVTQLFSQSMMLQKNPTDNQKIFSTNKSSERESSTFSNGGTLYFDAYLAYPNWTGTILERSFNALDIKILEKPRKSITFGGRIEFVFKSKLGIGFDFNYRSTSLFFSTELRNKITNTKETVNIRATYAKTQFLPTLAYHFMNDEKVDFYILGGFGYNNRALRLKFDQTFLNQNMYDLPIPTYVNLSFFPLAMRLALGFRYNFTRNIGINFAAGIGGPTISGGLTIRL